MSLFDSLRVTSFLGDGVDGVSEGGWADGDCDYPIAANGDAERRNGSKKFIDTLRINVLTLSERWLSALTLRGPRLML